MNENSPNPKLTQFEAHCDLGPTRAAKLLGVAYPTYAQMRSNSRPLQIYHQNHIQALMLLPAKTLRLLIEEHVHDQKTK